MEGCADTILLQRHEYGFVVCLWTNTKAACHFEEEVGVLIILAMKIVGVCHYLHTTGFFPNAQVTQVVIITLTCLFWVTKQMLHIFFTLPTHVVHAPIFPFHDWEGYADLLKLKGSEGTVKPTRLITSK